MIIQSLNIQAIPSKSIELLVGLVGKRIIKLVRYSWWPKQDVSAECSVPEDMVFSLTAGPLAILLEDGSIVGLSSDPSLNSVVVWQDQSIEGGYFNPSALNKDDELFPITNDDLEYTGKFWPELSGLSVIGLSVLRKRSMIVLECNRPSEIGLRFTLENGVQFIASHVLAQT